MMRWLRSSAASGVSRTSKAATRQPSSANRAAIWRPMPPVAPVTTATRRALISVNGKVERVALTETSANLDGRLAAHVGLHQQKVWDWDAFPASRGYPELARAQM